MKNQFQWQVDEEGNESTSWDGAEPPRNGRTPHFWLLAFLILTFVIGGWAVLRWQLNRAQDSLRQQVQAVLDLEQTAVQNHDGDLFYSLQVDDPAWFAAQLHPTAQARNRSARQVSEVEQVGDTLWANITWTANGRNNPCMPAANDCTTYQQISFFAERDGRLQHIPTAPEYWGRNFRLETNWGRLDYMEVDALWADEIASFVTAVISETCAAGCCAAGCLPDALPLTVAITPDQSETADPQRLHIPSPRLLALDSAGPPADLFWQELRHRLQSRLSGTPTIIRFAVPPEAAQVIEYETAAQTFMAAHPHIQVEIMPLSNPTPTELLAYDGAAFPLSEALLATGQIVDLTDYMQTDPDFAPADFYEQIWQGAEWHGRTWFLPYAAAMPVLYYDKTAYRQAEYPEPSLRWTWQEMAQDMIIVSNPYSKNRPSWGFLDPGSDALFSYAYNWQNECREVTTVRCDQPLTETAVSAALTWYLEMAGQPGQMPNLTKIPVRERDNLLLNWQSARRRAVIWVDSPRNYEFRLLLAPLGVVLFPGSNRFDGITPLHVSGHFISQQAQNPQAVWEWLRYLSFQPLRPQFRLIPARPSVAESSRFWQILPRELGNPMRIAFPFARPITLADQRYFTPEQITAVLSGTTSPPKAIHLTPPIPWFAEIR